jgi:PhzF family phenazine biosynthesis protein
MSETGVPSPSGRVPVNLPMFIIDAFAERPLAGNPAAVCPLENWLPATTMQAIAAEMNLSETVFFASQNREDFGIRWFTPTREVDLVGHATLAAGHLVLNRMRPGTTTVRFLSGESTLTVTRDGNLLALEMPALRPRPIKAPCELVRGLGRQPTTVLAAKHYLCVFDSAEVVANLTPDMAVVASLELPAVIVTAPSTDDADFVSRFFAPANGVPEDPVSGVAHLCLAPYWAERLGAKNLIGRQLSRRGGVVRCQDLGSRVRLSGSAIIVLTGHITI